ncbi:MAG: SMP-30/gluconolactonase/LRE family protein [Acidimicrobiales bacterium]
MASSLETLAYGYGLIEGPRVDADGNLYFSDVPNGGVYRLAPSGEVDVAIPKRRGVGGIAIHADGGLVVGGRNVCHVRNGETRVVFETDAGLNDLMTDADGRVVCGTLRSDPFGDWKDRLPGELVRIGLDGSSEEMYGDVSLTNGIGYSPDGSQIYHADTGRNRLICHDVVDDRYVERRDLRPRGVDPADFNPDGLAVDEAGVIWVADYGAGCARGLRPDGEEVARIEVPAKAVTSLCFGGADRRDLYIVTADNTDDPDRGGTVFRTRVETPGVVVAPARI